MGKCIICQRDHPFFSMGDTCKECMSAAEDGEPFRHSRPVTEDLATAGLGPSDYDIKTWDESVKLAEDILKESVAHGENLGRWLTCPRCNKTLYYTSGKPACNYGGCVNVPLDVPAHCVLTRAEADERAATLKAERTRIADLERENAELRAKLSPPVFSEYGTGKPVVLGTVHITPNDS